MQELNQQKFIEALKSARGKLETKNEYSDRMRISRFMLKQLETGATMPSLNILNRLCTITDTKLTDYFLVHSKSGAIPLALSSTDKQKLEASAQRMNVGDESMRS